MFNNYLQDEQPKHSKRKGDAYGYILGGWFGVALAIFGIISKEAHIPFSGSVKLQDDSLTYVLAIIFYVAFWLSCNIYGIMELRRVKKEIPSQSENETYSKPRSPLYRIFLALSVSILAIFAGGPALAMAGKPFILIVGIAGIAILVIGILLHQIYHMGLGFLLILVAGMALYFADGKL